MGEEEQSDVDRDELRFAVEQLHGTIVQNYTQSLQILGATLVVVTALMGFAFSLEVAESREKAGLFFGAEALAIVGLLQSLDRARSTHTIAAYLRVFVEPLLTHYKWESRLLEFHRRGFGAGTGGFTLGQWVVYVLVIIFNCVLANYYGWLGWADANPDLRSLIQGALVLVTLSVLIFAAKIVVKYERHQETNLDAQWLKIKKAEQ